MHLQLQKPYHKISRFGAFKLLEYGLYIYFYDSMLSFRWYWQKVFPASGLFLTYLGLYLMDGNGQPALLYLVPCTLGNQLGFLALDRFCSFCFAIPNGIFPPSIGFSFSWSLKRFVLLTFSSFLMLGYQVLLLYWVWWEVSWSTFGTMPLRKSHRHPLSPLRIVLEKSEGIKLTTIFRIKMSRNRTDLPKHWV